MSKHEKNKTQRSPDRKDASRVRTRKKGRGYLSGAWRSQSHLLQLEEEVFRNGLYSANRVKSIEGRKCPIKKDVCRISHGQCSSKRCSLKKVLRLSEKKDRVDYVRSKHGYSLQRACRLICFARSLYYYQPKRNDAQVKEKLLSLAEKKPMEGQDKFYQRIRLEGLNWNYKRVRRVYKLLGLNKRNKTRKRIPKRVKEPLLQPIKVNQMWSMDFMHDTLENKRKFRTLNVIDDYNREALAIDVQLGINSVHVTKVLADLIHQRGKPEWIRVDNGPEFISSMLNDWCLAHGIKLQFIQPGKPSQNGFIERFNRTFRQDVLDAYIFEDLSQVRILKEDWMDDYNNSRPHESLGGMTPVQFRLKKQLNNAEASFSVVKQNSIINENSLT